MRMPIDFSAIQLVSAGRRLGPRLQGDCLMPQLLVSLLAILLAILLVLWILGWILAHAGLVVIGVLGLGLYAWWKPRGRGELCVQRHEPSAPGDPSRLGLSARGRTGSRPLRRSRAVDLPRERGPALVSGPTFTALADASVLDLAVEGQPPSPSQVTKWATDGRGGSEGLPLDQRTEKFDRPVQNHGIKGSAGSRDLSSKSGADRSTTRRSCSVSSISVASLAEGEVRFPDQGAIVQSPNLTSTVELVESRGIHGDRRARAC